MNKIRDQWIAEGNIARFRDQLEFASDSSQREILHHLIAVEQEKLDRLSNNTKKV